MKLILRCAAVATTLAILVTGANAQCTIYPDADYQGSAGVIQPNDYVKFFEGTPPNVQHNGLPDNVRTFTDVSWKDRIGSVKLAGNCELITYDKVSGKTLHRRYIEDSPKMIANMQKSVATEVAAAFCSCK